MLEMLAYKVTARHAGPEAPEVVRKAPCETDLAVGDLTRPKIPADRLPKVRPGLPIIPCTGFGNRLPKQKAAGSGIKKIIS